MSYEDGPYTEDEKNLDHMVERVEYDALQRKLDFYVEQLRKVEGERDRWREIAGKGRETLFWIYEYGKGVDEMTAWAKETLALFPKEPSDNG